MASPAVPHHIHALLSGVLLPFSSLLIAVLSHYQIHALHLDHSSLVLISAFVFLCEAFVGVTPSVALLRHFLSLALVSEEQCSGCWSLKMADASVPGALNAELLSEAEGSGEVEQSLERERLEVRERHVSLAKESLASREAKLQEEIDRGVVEAQRSLLLDYRAKLRLQESRFHERRDHLKSKVKGAASLVGETSEEAIHARGLKLECSRMFQSLEGRASQALSDIYGEGVSSPLVPDDARYLGFFLRVVECFEAGVEKSHALVEVKSRDLLGQGASDVFSHLLRLDPDFDFAAMLDPVLETIREALAKWVDVHLEDLLTRLASRDCGVSSGNDVSS
ncbi:hypothetical protein D1007_27849 [Hordeum vulgare]|nr:hypothetical protein D1007_27849 [Hordeum vulgare]